MALRGETMSERNFNQISLLKLLTDSVPVMISYIDNNLIYRFSSKEHAAWMARTPDQVVGRHVQEIVTPEAFSTLLPSLRRALQGEQFEFKNKLYYADGKVRNIRVVYIPDIAEDGTVLGLASMAEDLTDIVTYQKALKESEERLVHLLENTPIPVFANKPNDGVIIFANRAANLFFRGEPKGMEGRSFFPHWVNIAERAPAIAELEKYGIVRNFEFQAYRHGNIPAWMLASSNKIRFQQEEVYLTILQDISERHQAEALLKNLNMTLEQRVEEHKYELEETQRQLIEKEKLAVLGKLTATVSHEIRNPLGTIAATMGMLKKRIGGEDQRRVERIERSVERISSIIEDLLSYTRNPVVNPGSISLDQWLQETLAELALPDTVRLTFKGALPGLRITTDEERVRRAIVNLVENATQSFSQPDRQTPDSPQILVSTRKNGASVFITIADNGPGIGKEELEKIFEPLFSTKSYGTGLGLPTVRQVLRQIGGDIQIESKPMHGTEATITLPITPNGH